MTHSRVWLWAAVAAVIALFPGKSGAGDRPVTRVAVCPLAVHSSTDLSYLKAGLVDVFTSRLQVEGAIVPVDKVTVRDALGDLDSSNAPEKTLRALLAELRADYLVYGSLTQLGESLSLDVRLLGRGEGGAKSFSALAENLNALLPQVDRLLGEVRSALLPEGRATPDVGPTVAGAGVGSAGPETRQAPGATPKASAVRTGPASTTQQAAGGAGTPLEPTLTLDVPLDARGLGVGDVDGDGKNEVVIADSTRVFVYRLEDGELQQLTQYEGKSYEDFIHLDLADLDGNGAQEIFLTSLRRGPRSLVLGWDAGSLRVIASDLPYFLRALDVPGGPTQVIGQEVSGGEWPFSGDRFEIKWREGRYVTGQKLSGVLPIYGYLPVDLDGNGDEETVVLDGEGRLSVYFGGDSPRWRSADTYAGGCVVYPVAPRRAGDESPRDLEISPRFLSLPPTAGGVPRVFLARNIPSGLLGLVRRAQSYDRAEVVDLAWTGKRLERVWRFDEIRGCITDLQYQDADNDGRPDLVAVATAGAGFGPFQKGASSVYVFQGTVP